MCPLIKVILLISGIFSALVFLQRLFLSRIPVTQTPPTSSNKIIGKFFCLAKVSLLL